LYIIIKYWKKYKNTKTKRIVYLYIKEFNWSLSHLWISLYAPPLKINNGSFSAIYIYIYIYIAEKEPLLIFSGGAYSEIQRWERLQLNSFMYRYTIRFVFVFLYFFQYLIIIYKKINFYFVIVVVIMIK